MIMHKKKILVTGSNGFIGKNLLLWLQENKFTHVSKFNSDDDTEKLQKLIEDSDVVFHLAGVNRSNNLKDFESINVGLTEIICKLVRNLDVNKVKGMKLIYISSAQYNLRTPYGLSKKASEKLLVNLAKDFNLSTTIFRLPGVFGKWSKPNYNSVVATFCHNIAQKLPIKIDDPNKVINLVYIDDVMKGFLNAMSNIKDVYEFGKIRPQYKISLQEIADKIRSFSQIKNSMMIPCLGSGFNRALYSTYLSYLSPNNFKYTIPSYEDERGAFVEMIKTQNNGQVSFFTAHSGVIRGGHYHHSKNEKFLVVRGTALFRFRNLVTNEKMQFISSDDNMEIVDTVPGWVHDIKNVGNKKLIVMIWANEVFNKEKPDTFCSEL
jgi:UDP-2-acetamido-2,6-beta-L-arabino-hexul-4-ose reductase